MNLVPVNVGDLLLNATVLLYVSFFVGVIFRLGLRAGNAFRSNVNMYPTRSSFLLRNWDIFLVRTGILTVGFSIWLTHPGTVSDALTKIAIPAGIANWLTVPPTLGTAFMVGLMGDWGIDQLQIRLAQKYPWLPDIVKGEIPTYDPAVVKVESLSKERKVGEG